MDLRDPAPGTPWAPQQFWVCPSCGRHFWTTHAQPPGAKPADARAGAEAKPAAAGTTAAAKPAAPASPAPAPVAATAPAPSEPTQTS